MAKDVLKTNLWTYLKKEGQKLAVARGDRQCFGKQTTSSGMEISERCVLATTTKWQGLEVKDHWKLFNDQVSQTFKAS